MNTQKHTQFDERTLNLSNLWNETNFYLKKIKNNKLLRIKPTHRTILYNARF